MKILIVHLDYLINNFVATSVIKGLYKKIEDPKITWTTYDDNKYIFEYNKNINKVINKEEMKNDDTNYDILINFTPVFDHKYFKDIKFEHSLGFNFVRENGKYFNNIYGNNTTNKNIFQIYYKLAGLSWEGEGYDVNYFPRNKTKKNRIGISVAHANLRNYVNDNLKLDTKKLYHVPYKKNYFKRMDELNKCQKIITDDLTTFHLAMALRKYVYFLQILPLNTKLELFGKGEIHQVPKNIVQ